jgi:hypothetical protein
MAEGGSIGLNAGNSVADGGCNFTFITCNQNNETYFFYSNFWSTFVIYIKVIINFFPLKDFSRYFLMNLQNDELTHKI